MPGNEFSYSVEKLRFYEAIHRVIKFVNEEAMKKRTKFTYQTTEISFDDFIAHPDSQLASGKTAAEMAEESRAAADALQKRLRDIKKAKQREKSLCK
jgi:hypothetical protein